MADDLKMKLQIDTATATSDLGKTAAAADDLSDALDDTRTAGQKVADQLKSATDDIVTQLKSDADAADALAKAMGPELLAAADGGIDGVIAKLQALGLSSDEIKADAAALADAFQHSSDAVADLQRVDTELDQIETDAKTAKTAVANIGDADVSGATTQAHGLGDEMHRVGHETDQSRSVMANFAGNAASSLPGVSSAFGPLNQAIGQFGEYATEGNIKIGELAKMAGPMIGVSAAMLLIDSAMSKIAAKNVFRKDQVEGFTKAILDGKDAAEALADRLREAGGIKLENIANAASPWSDAISDITSVVVKAGLTVDQYSQLVIGGVPAIKAWFEAQQDAGTVTKDTITVLRSLGEQQQDYVKGQAAAAVTAQFLKKDTEDLTVSTQGYAAAAIHADDVTADLTKSTDDATRATEQAKVAADNYHDAMEAQRHATQDLVDTERAAIDSKYAARKASGDAADAVAAYNVAETDLGTAIDKSEAAHRRYGDSAKATKQADQDAADATKNFADATDSAFDAVLNKSEADVKAKGAALDSKAGIDGQIASLEAEAGTLAADSPLRARIQEYIADLRNIPTTINTSLDLHVTGGANVAGGGRGPNYKGAAGAVVTKPTVALIGDDGPEELRPLHEAPGASPVSNGRGAGTVNNYFTITTHPGMRAADLAGELRRHDRRNGTG